MVTTFLWANTSLEMTEEIADVQYGLTLGSSEYLLSKWLACDEHDEALASKLAEPELYKLINARLGLEIEAASISSRVSLDGAGVRWQLL